MTGGRVVVLGPTGRNFAAGMSGGLAFVLDEDGAFGGRMNPDMANQMEPLDEGDAIEVRALVAEHVERTGSPVGQRVLDDWDELRPSFVKVFPTDYKRVLAERAAEESAASNGASPNGSAPRVDEFESETVDVVGAPHVREKDGE
jgi:glutamate synthase domain-containing protein 3